MPAIKWSVPAPERDPGLYPGGRRYLIDGRVKEWTGDAAPVRACVHEEATGKPRELGVCAQVDGKTALEALEAARKAYDRGRGEWPTAGVARRIRAMEVFLGKMKERRLEVARLLCWEIGKPWADSLAEFDRTVEYGVETINALKEMDRVASGFARQGGFLAQIRRSPIGVGLCMGPYNYPLNENFTTLLPALIMGNAVVVKLPKMGMLCNLPLLEAFAEAFPPGVVNVIAGDGRTVVSPLLASGHVDLLAFIGSSKVANLLKQQHPRPNRLRSVLGLESKNPAVVLPGADLASAAKECALGALTFNGQRCTALKLIFVQARIADAFLSALAGEVDRLPAGMPYEDGVFLTPLPDAVIVERMRQMTRDALDRGARIVNAGGGETDRTFFRPAVVFPVKPGMRLWEEEQFGPLVAVAPYEDPAEVLDYLAEGNYGQQVSLFGSDPAVIGPLCDALVNQVCRVNLNSQCRRGPDTFPFNGRKDSAEGTLSITDALRVFSIRTLVAAKESEANVELVQAILRGRHSKFLTTDYLF